jgi:ankyrin repeat protein
VHADAGKPHARVQDERAAGVRQQLAQKKEKKLVLLHNAARDGYHAAVRSLLQIDGSTRADKNGTDTQGRTALFLASREGHADVVVVLLNKGASVDLARKEDDATPMYVAAQRGHTDVVAVLVEAEADVDLARKNGSTALFVACQKGHTDVVTLLLEYKAQVDRCNKNGATPLYIAAQEGHADVVSLLANFGARLNQGRNDGATPLFVASQKGHVEVVAILLIRGADENKVNPPLTLSQPLLATSQPSSDIITNSSQPSSDIITIPSDIITTPLISSQPPLTSSQPRLRLVSLVSSPKSPVSYTTLSGIIIKALYHMPPRLSLTTFKVVLASSQLSLTSSQRRPMTARRPCTWLVKGAT